MTYSGAALDKAKAELLPANTEEAISRGAFGVPSFWSTTKKELFWGEDRVPFAFAAEGVPADVCGEPRLALPPPQRSTPPTLTFYHDFASPWSYVASTQVERIAKRNGARVEYVPILLGALFKAIGTPNVPMMAMAPAKRQYMSKDIGDWCKFWNIELNFPSDFPLRTVLPLRVAIQVRCWLPLMASFAQLTVRLPTRCPRNPRSHRCCIGLHGWTT